MTAMRGLALSALLLAGCSGGPPAATASPAPSPATTVAVSAAPTTPSPPIEPTPAVNGLPRSFTRVVFDAGIHEGTVTSDKLLQLGPSVAKGSYTDPYGGTISDERGTWTSAAVRQPFAFDRLIASWNATTPAGTWIDVQMRALARRLGIPYVAPLAALCNADGCIARTGAGGNEITVWDTAHFTRAGSALLARSTERRLLSGLGG